jgi:hypothetical protein
MISSAFVFRPSPLRIHPFDFQLRRAAALIRDSRDFLSRLR